MSIEFPVVFPSRYEADLQPLQWKDLKRNETNEIYWQGTRKCMVVTLQIFGQSWETETERDQQQSTEPNIGWLRDLAKMLIHSNLYYEYENSSACECMSACVCMCVHAYMHACLCVYSPWYNRTGWLGIKHQLTYLLIVCVCVCDVGVHVHVWVCEPVHK